jgi:PAS domain S-box-containing protein
MSSYVDLSGAKVLMVDDTPANIDVLRKVLSIEGYRLSFANSGEKALKIVERAIPDLILLDVMMPGMDGFETCRHLKSDEKTQDIPIIFITAKTDMEDLVEGFKAGAVDYITKPFRQEEVCMRVRTHLQTRILMTQRESLLQNIQANEERFRLLANWSPVGIFQVDHEGKLTYTNKKWHDILGRVDFQVIDETWLNAVVYEEDRSLVQQTWLNSLQSQQGYALKFRLATTSGGTRWVHVQTTPLFSGNQELTGFIGTIEDISEFKLTEQQMLSAKESAEAIAKAKAEFLSGMTHELRTPLNAIIGYSEMLSEDASGEGYGEDLEKITSASKYLLNLINNVLDLSKVEANRMTVYLEEFNIPLLINEVVSTIQPLVNKNNNELEVILSPEAQTMYADATKVRQILYNLLSNACKFTKAGKIVLQVQTVMQESVNFIRFSVTDTGIGLTDEQLEKLFQKYAQADASIARDYGGTGLGLVLTQQFCNMMGGSVHVTSKHGSGSEFAILLPRQVTKEPHQDEKIAS